MSRKSAKVAAYIEQFRGADLDPHYLGFFDCFNRQLFYEAHDVLEELWLQDRNGADGAFYKGLIQLAGAFVHMQKNRLTPAAALLKLAHKNLGCYESSHHKLDIAEVLGLIESWLARLEKTEFQLNPLTETSAPKIILVRP